MDLPATPDMSSFVAIPSFLRQCEEPAAGEITGLAERVGERTIKARSTRAFIAIRFSVPLLACWAGLQGLLPVYP
jgi:hypothetical protein